MIRNISAAMPVQPTLSKIQGRPVNIRNISLNELDAITLDMLKNGEITLKERLPFVALNTKPLHDLGQNIKLKYYDIVWTNTGQKRDMLKEFQNILGQQIRDNAGNKNIDFTRGAIGTLEKIAARGTFKSILSHQAHQTS